MYSLDVARKRINERGPRYAISGTLRPQEVRVDYADTADKAELIRAEFQDEHYYQVMVYAPDGSVDLATLGGARIRAKLACDEATAVLRAGVLRAVEEGRSEVEIARTAQVDRMTVRSWIGKRHHHRDHRQ